MRPPRPKRTPSHPALPAALLAASLVLFAPGAPLSFAAPGDESGQEGPAAEANQTDEGERDGLRRGALERVRGEKVWEQLLTTSLVAAPIVIGGRAGLAPSLDAALADPAEEPGLEGGLVLALADALERRRASDGSLAWRREDLAGALVAPRPLTGDQGTARLALSVSRPGSKGALVLVDAASGATIAEQPLDAVPLGSPLVRRSDEGALLGFALVLEGPVVMLADSEARPLERVDVEGLEHPVLVEHAGRIVLIAREGGQPRALGDPRPGRRTPSLLGTTTSSAGEQLLVGSSGQDEALALKCRTLRRGTLRCRERWTQILGGSVSTRPLVMGERVYVPSWDTHLYAFELDNGHLAWRQRLLARLTSTPVPWGQALALLGEDNARIEFVRIDDGARAGTLVVGREELGEICTQPPVFLGERLFVPLLEPVDEAPTLVAFDLEASFASEALADETRINP